MFVAYILSMALSRARDSCWLVYTAYGIAFKQFFEWNASLTSSKSLAKNMFTIFQCVDIGSFCGRLV